MLEPKYLVYEDGVISVALQVADSDDDQNDLLHVAMKWLDPNPLRHKDGTTLETTNLMGGETAWFLLPHTFGAAIGMKLVEQKTAGLPGFNEVGFSRLVRWLIEMEYLDDSMCY